MKLVFVIGIAFGVPGPIYLLALKDIAAANLPVAADVGAVVGYTMVKLAFAEVPLVGYMVAPQRTREAVVRFNDWLRGRNLQVGAGLCASVAAILTVQSVIAIA